MVSPASRLSGTASAWATASRWKTPIRIELEELFTDEGHDVEVINFGITATNTLQQLALVQKKVLKYAPDLVVLGFNLNDYKINKETEFDRAKRVSGIDYHVNPDRTVTILPPDRTMSEEVKNTLNNRLALVRLMRAAKQGIFPDLDPASGPGDPVTAALIDGRGIPQENYGTVNAAVLEMRDLLRANSARFAVLFIPAMTELPKPYPETAWTIIRMPGCTETSISSWRGTILCTSKPSNFSRVSGFETSSSASLMCTSIKLAMPSSPKGLHDFLVRERLVGGKTPLAGQ